MRSCVFLFFLSFLAFSNARIAMRWFNVPVGHYNPLIRRFFDLRYFVNDAFYTPGGPIFIYIGGGVEVYEDYLESGAMHEIAQETGAYLFALEHRYFGESKPTDNAALSNLAFLTIHQAVADIGEFISFIKDNFNQASESKVILWGKGYGGALAVWSRHKFHHLVDGVWASSAPVDAVLETQQFMRNTANTITSIGGAECTQIIANAIRQIDDAVRLRNTSHFEERFRLCSPVDLDDEDDISRLFFGIASDIGRDFLMHANFEDVEEKCNIIRSHDDPENPIEALALWFVDVFHANTSCLNYNNTAYLENFKQEEWDSPSTSTGLRQNFWLQCTQLGQFETSGIGDGHVFGWRFDFDFFQRSCADVFDRNLFNQNFMEEGVKRTNVFYGGLDPKISNVLFTQGDIDPRRSLGPEEDINENSPVVIIPGQSYGRDFGSPSETDNAALLQTKERARELILQWLS